MNKSVKTMIISVLLIIALPMARLSAQVSVWDGTWEPWTQGTGTEADPFLIENAQQLAYLAYRVNNGLDAGGGHVSNHDYHYKLMVDVNLNGSETFQWTPIGYWNSGSDYQCFGGHFDGNRHAVLGLYINSSANRVGFFGYVDGVTIENFNVSGDTIATTNSIAGGIVGAGDGTIVITNCYNMCNISSNSSVATAYSGGIIGYASSATITNCYNKGDVSVYYWTSASTGSSVNSGGVLGFADSSTTISDCYNMGNVSSICSSLAWDYARSGGILGCATLANITNCYNTGNISTESPEYSYCGGVFGHSSNSVNITNCYNSGSVSSISPNYNLAYSGGVLGIGTSVSITNSYNVGTTTSTNYNGGLIGYMNSGTASNSYYLSTCGGSNTYGGEPKTDVYMKSAEFVEVLNEGTFSWRQDTPPYMNDGYPILTWIIGSVVTADATNVVQTHATLHGNISVENGTILSQGFEFKKSTDSNYQTINVSDVGAISYELYGLLPGTQYTYRVFCTVADQGTSHGAKKTFTTLPVNVTTHYATNVTGSSAILHGSIEIGDATVVSKGFEYRIAGNPNYTTINVNGNENDFTEQLSGLQPNTIYEYRAFLNIAENVNTYYGATKTFEVTWLNLDTIPIYNADMLRWVSEQCNSGTTFQGKYIKLMNDIVLPENVPNNMTSIGVYPNYPFMGTFDGNEKHIYNLYIDQPNTPYQGFFGYTLNANLYNVGLVNITASGRNYTGGMVAYAQNTHLRDCYVNGGTLFALSYCGGLIGYQEQGTNSIVSGCYNTCSVSGNHYVGGLIGFSNYSTVRNSYVAGPVSGQGNGIGAIIGGANEVLMYYCYFSTEMTGQTNAIGENNIGGGKDGGEGLTNAQMRDPQFVATLNQGLMTPVWMADYTSHINNGFPIIKWQRPGTSVEEHDAAKSCISLYPNPANGFVTIQSDNSNVSLQHVEVYDITGRKVMSEVLDGQSKEFSIDKLRAGVYHICIQTNNGCFTNLKLIVQ